MPSETFFRLPPSKQDRIIEAIKAEIARSPYETFSISNVLRESGISRGSFYQYFRSKDEIYLYFLEEYQDSILAYANKAIEKYNGDFFDTLSDTFHYAVRMLCYKDSRAFRHNLFCNIRLYELFWQNNAQTKEKFRHIRECVDLSHLRVNDLEELHTLADICFVNALRDASSIFMKDECEERVLEVFARKLELMHHAFVIE